MTPNLDWLQRLNRGNKGIWGIEYPSGSLFDVDCVVQLSPLTCETEVVRVVRGSNGVEFSESSKGITRRSFYNVVERASKLAKENGRQSIRIVVGDFHKADVGEQCVLIRMARDVQESSTEFSWQFAFCGSWSYYAFSWAYREKHGQTNSPPAHSKDLLYVPAWCSSDVMDLLRHRGVLGLSPSPIDRIACDFLIEQTAGDEFLIRQTVDHLAEREGNWTSNIEQVLDELVSVHEVVEAIGRRVDSLDVDSKSELTKLLWSHGLVRDFDSVASEQLWLAGLVQRHSVDAGKHYIQIAGPIINIVVRHILATKEPGSMINPNCLCFAREAISTAAYRRIAQTENMLRNLIVSAWHSDRGDRWSENLKAISSPSSNWEAEKEIAGLVIEFVRSEFGITPEPVKADAPTASAASSGRLHRITLFESAQDWQRRQRDSHAVELTHDNLMHFLTTGGLFSVLVNKKHGLCGEGKPFQKKEHIVTALEEYLAIRSAVAHNQPIKLSTISRLDDLQRKFLDWLTVFSDRVIA